MIEIKGTTRNSWKFNPINMPIPLEYNRVLSLNDWELLKRGLKPKVMEDKWFIFLEENTMYFARSWTGYCIFSIEVKVLTDETVLLHKAIMESDKSIYRGDIPDSILDDLISMVIRYNNKR